MQPAHTATAVGPRRLGAPLALSLSALSLTALSLAWPTSAVAQSVSGEPPRAPTVIGPAPTNPLDTGLGTTAGTNPAGTPGVVAPSAGPVLPSQTATPGPSVLEVPAGTRLTVASRTPTATALPTLGEVLAGLPPALQPRAGGLTADGAVERALRRNYGVAAARAGVQGAEAAQTEAGLSMIPSIALSARYTRLSEYPPAQFQSFNTPGCLMNIPACTANPSAYLVSTTLQAAILDQFGLRATITIPVSDIPLRLLQVYRAAGLTTEARRLDLAVQRQQAALEARLGFYEFVRAVGQRAVTEQSLEVARRRRGDLLRAVEAGTVARAELLRVDATVADLERIVTLAQNGYELAEAVLRQRIGAQSGEALAVGEGIGEMLPPGGSLQETIERAVHSRAELLSIDAQLRALGANQFAVYAGMFPSVAVVGNADYANPNSRIFPLTAEFRGTWDLTVQASWNPTSAIVAGATASRLSAQRTQIEAQAAQLREGIELEVRNNWAAVRAAEAQIESARAALASAEEDLRVRRERVGVGAAIATDLADAETAVLRARLNVVNAAVDLRIARARLRRAVGTREGAE